MTMLAMAILVHFWVLYWAAEPAIDTKAKLAALHCSLANWRILGQLVAQSGPCMARFMLHNRA